MSSVKFKAAPVHAAPVYMNKKATLEKVVKLIKQAGEEGIKLLVFPETFVPGYPVKSYVHDPSAKHWRVIDSTVFHRMLPTSQTSHCSRPIRGAITRRRLFLCRDTFSPHSLSDLCRRHLPRHLGTRGRWLYPLQLSTTH